MEAFRWRYRTGIWGTPSWFVTGLFALIVMPLVLVPHVYHAPAHAALRVDDSLLTAEFSKKTRFEWDGSVHGTFWTQ